VVCTWADAGYLPSLATPGWVGPVLGIHKNTRLGGFFCANKSVSASLLAGAHHLHDRREQA
jgi:hypothetical protein